jgi:Leucine-rich repeat (LRR) protein
MTPEEAYEEALRRIREAEETGALALDLRGWKGGRYTRLETLTQLPPELALLTSLQSLDLSGCEQLSGDLAPLGGLTSLQSLSFDSTQINDFSPLARLTSLQLLNLSFCTQLMDLSPLADLTSLQSRPWIVLAGNNRKPQVGSSDPAGEP